ncbi:MAG: retropepsin-like aspartic protease [Candidatus Micrarchaeota archaeon]
MRREFQFKPVETDSGTIFRPLITVTVECAGKSRFVEFLVDSGADFSLLGAEFAAQLGMDLSEGRKREVRGVQGHKIVCVEKKVLLTVPGFGNPFESSVIVGHDLRPIHNLLGRDNFFHHYRVGFDQKERKLVLDDRNGR